MMYQIIETIDATTKRSKGYFFTLDEAKEFINNKRKEYKQIGYITHIVKNKYSKSKNFKFHLSMRKRTRTMNKYISWTVVEISTDEKVNHNLADNEIFGDLYGEKRLEQIALRLSRLKAFGYRYMRNKKICLINAKKKTKSLKKNLKK